jgi:translation initiation factor 5
MKLNIDKDTIDLNYRYKMNAIHTKIEGRGNGIKTIILNLMDVADDLKRNPEEILKFLGHQKGSNTSKIDEKFIINGSFETDDLQLEIYNYINNYVMCNQCKLPETIYTRQKKKIFKKCNACSNETELVDKLKSFISKNIS